MPWRECRPMNERLRFIAPLLEGEIRIRMTAGTTESNEFHEPDDHAGQPKGACQQMAIELRERLQHFCSKGGHLIPNGRQCLRKLVLGHDAL